jgi:SagB-type dehydrogenase family enzyme
MGAEHFYRWTELGPTTYPAWRDGILQAEAGGAALPGEPRSYPGYPRWPLDRVRPGWRPSLERVLTRRRCLAPLGTDLPPRRTLGRLLGAAHGITGSHGRGPVPSAGGLQALELYLANWATGWLPAGWYHYDRRGHHLSQVAAGTGREELRPLVPSLERIDGGALLWLLVGDGARVRGKYGERGLRFLLLEAGHLMQNLCLLSAGLGLATVPLGGYFERALARRLRLPADDEVLYAGLCGEVA